jgi:hypothetical protein
LTYDDRISTIVQLTASVSKVRIIWTNHLFDVINFLFISIWIPKIFVPVILGGIIEARPMSLIYLNSSFILSCLICFILILIAVKMSQRKSWNNQWLSLN